MASREKFGDQASKCEPNRESTFCLSGYVMGGPDSAGTESTKTHNMSWACPKINDTKVDAKIAI